MVSTITRPAAQLTVKAPPKQLPCQIWRTQGLASQSGRTLRKARTPSLKERIMAPAGTSGKILFSVLFFQFLTKSLDASIQDLFLRYTNTSDLNYRVVVY